MNVFNQTLANSMLDVYAIRSDLQSTLSNGEPVDEELHAEFEAAIAQAVYQVRPHVVGGDVPELRKLWDEYGVERLLDFESRTTVRVNDGVGHFGMGKEEEVREVQRVDLYTLLSITRLLDRISKELGLMKETERSGRSGGRIS